jgi:hypothetical protein
LAALRLSAAEAHASSSARADEASSSRAHARGKEKKPA